MKRILEKLSVIGIFSKFVSSLTANLQIEETVGQVGTYCAAHSGPRDALFGPVDVSLQ